MNKGERGNIPFGFCRGNSVSVSIKGDDKNRTVYAMISGQVVKVNDRMGSVTIKSDSLMLKYWVINRKVSLGVGDSIQYGEEIGVLSKYFDKIRIDLLSGRKDSFFSLLEDACFG